VLFFAGPVIALFPKPVLGGVLVFLGLTFMADWLYDGWRKFSRPDYAIVVLITLVMSTFGLLPGLGLGLALAAGLFIVQYSRVPVVRHFLSGRTRRSRVVRTYAQAELLRQEGQALQILELQGYVFSEPPTASTSSSKERLEAAGAQPPSVLMLDFHWVNGIDAWRRSAVRLKRLLRKYNVCWCSRVASEIEQKLRKDVLTASDQDHWRLFPDLDQGGMVRAACWRAAGQQAVVSASLALFRPARSAAGWRCSLRLGLAAEGSSRMSTRLLLRLLGYLERVELEPGQALICQGEPHKHMYFLDAGELTIEYRTGENQTLRLETSGPGTIVGELGLYLGTPASASVNAAQASTVYGLSYDNLRRLEKEDPLAAALLHRFLLKRVGQRLQRSLEAMDALAE
jgi:SulP family sulfate permease